MLMCGKDATRPRAGGGGQGDKHGRGRCARGPGKKRSVAPVGTGLRLRCPVRLPIEKTMDSERRAPPAEGEATVSVSWLR
jgi:hypothetical protein